MQHTSTDTYLVVFQGDHNGNCELNVWLIVFEINCQHPVAMDNPVRNWNKNISVKIEY